MVAAPVESRNLWAALILVLCAVPVGAQTTYTWSGGGDANWSTAANWGGTAPTSDLDNTLLVLAGSTQLTNTLDFDLSAKSLTFGTGAGAFVVGGSNTLTLDSGGITIANHNNQTFNANLALVAAQTWANNGIGTFTVGGAVDNRGSLLAIGGDIIGAGPTVFNGVISGSGGLTKTGAGHGRVVLSGTNTYTGVTMISGGTLQTNLLTNGGSNSGIGASSNAAANLVLNGGTLRYTGGAVSTDRLFTLGTSGGTIDVTGSGSVNFTNTGSMAFSGSGARTLTLTSTTGGSGIHALAAAIGDGPGGATSLTKNGAPSWVLSGASTYTGATNVAVGTLRAGAVNTLPSLTAVAVSFGATLDLGAYSQTIGSLAGAGKVTLSGAALTVGGNDSSTTYTGVISGSGAVTKVGAGTWSIRGANTYMGPTSINGGTVLTDAPNTLSPGSALTIGGDGTLILDDHGQIVGSLAGSGTLDLGTGGGDHLTAGGNNTSTVFSGQIIGPGSLTKVGTGTMVFSGNRLFAGLLNVNGGTVLVKDQSGSGSGTGSSIVSVNNGGSFGGSGHVGIAGATSPGLVHVNRGGTIRGGDENWVGTLTLSARLNVDDGATLDIRVTDASRPSGTAGGSTIGTLPNPTSNNFVHMRNGFFTNLASLNYIVDGTGTPFAAGGSYSYQIGLADGYDFSAVNITNQAQFTAIGFNDPVCFSITGNGSGALFLNITPVPEPAAVSAVGGAGLCLLRMRRRRHLAAAVRALRRPRTRRLATWRMNSI